MMDVLHFPYNGLQKIYQREKREESEKDSEVVIPCPYWGQQLDTPALWEGMVAALIVSKPQHGMLSRAKGSG
jgi:hypothetical protein